MVVWYISNMFSLAVTRFLLREIFGVAGSFIPIK